MNISYIVLLICVALCVFMFVYFNWYIKKRTSAKGFFAELQEQKNEAARLMADIDIVTDRNLTLAENKIKELKDLLEETEKRISVYIKEREKSRAAEELYTQLGRGIKSALYTPSDSPVVPVQAVQNLLPIEETDIPPQKPAQQNKQEQKQKQKPPSKREIRSHIDQLINEGLEPQQIAKKLNISVAEVNLAMQLRI